MKDHRGHDIEVSEKRVGDLALRDKPCVSQADMREGSVGLQGQQGTGRKGRKWKICTRTCREQGKAWEGNIEK